jgi:ribokinase
VYDVAVVGSANVDLVASTARLPGPGETVLGDDVEEHPGGKGLNQAVAAARCGARVTLVGAVGADDAGRFLRSIALADGIGVDDLRDVVGVPTGRALITVDRTGENTIVVIPGANSRAKVDRLPAAAVVVAQLEVPVETVIDAFRAARATDATTILNPAPARPLPAELVELTDVLVPNEHELDLIGHDRALLELGVRAVVTTLGADGVRVSESGGRSWRQDPIPVTPVDSTGAGDAFCGALAARLASGDELRAAVRFAAAAGALATTLRGAVPSLPRRTAVETSLAR